MRDQIIQNLPIITRRINRAPNLDKMLHVALQETLKEFEVRDGAILIFNRSHVIDKFMLSEIQGDCLAENQDASDMLLYLANEVAQSEKSIHYQESSLFPAVPITLRDSALHSLICVPIENEKRILGILLVGHQKSGFLKSVDLQLARSIAENVALAIEAHVLRTISTELSTMPVENILSKIAEVACFLFAAQASGVLLVDNRRDEDISGARFPAPKHPRSFKPRPKGLTQQVTRTCLPLIISNVQGNPDIKPTTIQREIQTIIGVPLKVNQYYEGENRVRAIGALFVDLLQKRKISEHETEILQSLANQAAIAIENDRHIRALRRLNSSSFDIVSVTQDIPELADTVLSHAVRLVDAEGGRLCLLNEENTEIRLQKTINFNEDSEVLTEKIDVGVFGRVVKSKIPFAMSNYANWAERRKEFEQFTAVAGVPIIHLNQLWGVITVHDTRDGRIFTERETELLTNLGNLAAVAFSDASRLDDLERLIESAYAAVIAVDNNGKVTQFNKQAEQMLQYAREDVLGKNIVNYYFYDTDPRRIQRLMLDSTEGQAKDFTTYLKSKKGQKIPIKLSASLLFDYEGRRSGSVGFFQDQRDEAGLSVASLLDQDEIFHAIVKQAWEMTGASNSAHLSLQIDNKLHVSAAHPRETLAIKQKEPIDFQSGERIGISGRAFRTGESQLVTDVTVDLDYICHDEKTLSELAVPIRTQEGIVGVIDVQYPEKDAFSETDQRNLETLARYAAIAIHNSQLYDESKLDKRRFEAIAEIIRGATQTLAINDLLRSTCKLLEEKIFHDVVAVVSIRLYDPVEKLLRFNPEWHESFHQRIEDDSDRDVTSQELDTGLCGRVATELRSQNVGNVDGLSEGKEFYRLIPSTQSEMAAPIYLEESNQLLGVLDVQSPFKNAFSQNDLEFIEVLARHLAVDIDKAKLAESQQRNIGEQNARRRAIEAVATQSSELRETVDEIIKQVWQIAEEQDKSVNSVVLRQVRNNKSVLVAAYPPQIEQRLGENFTEIDIRDGVEGLIGISGRAILSEETQLINDVSIDPDYRKLHDSTRSELTIPLRFNNEVIAVMDIECAEKNAFREEDQQIFEELAAQAGIAVHGSYQYDALERRSRHQEAVHQASSLISQGIKYNQSELLHQIVEQAVERIIPANGKKATLGVLQLYDAEKNELQLESLYPRAAEKDWARNLGTIRSLDYEKVDKIGTHGRAILEHKSQVVPDVSLDPDYMVGYASTRSELVVLLLDDDSNVLGTLGLESDELNAFDEEDRQALLNLAYLAAIAIQNSEQYHELEETRGALAARTAVAWLAAERAAWRHNIVGHIATLENYIKLLEKDLERNAEKKEFQERFRNMRQVIDRTREHKIAEPLSPDKGVKAVIVDEFLTQWLEKVYWDPALFQDDIFIPKLNSQDALIRVNTGWLQLALDNIVKNSLLAMENSKVKQLTVTTSLVNEQVEIIFSDTGPGIPLHIRNDMFKRPIPKKKGDHGEGIGQLLSGVIIENYGGKIDILDTSEAGTSIRIQLPIVYSLKNAIASA